MTQEITPVMREAIAVAVPATEGTQLARPAALRATCWGTRGSVPSPGPLTAQYGGNTPCVEVRLPDGHPFIFDAGTGIRRLGLQLSGETTALEADLFLTHFHWDHIQGLPFFAPIYNPSTVLRIHAPSQGQADIESIFAGQMAPVHFPVPFDALEAALRFEDLRREPWLAKGVEVAALRLKHPAYTVGYRVRANGISVAYMPDNELHGQNYPVPTSWYEELLAFLDGVDLLFHDAMYTEAEYEELRGWGHSTYGQALLLAKEAGVRRLRFFHHAPDRSDHELTRILGEMQDEGGRIQADVDVGIAMEGESLTIGASE